MVFGVKMEFVDGGWDISKTSNEARSWEDGLRRWVEDGSVSRPLG